MPDVLPAPDEVAALCAASARLREVIEAKDTEIGVLRSVAEAFHAQLGELRAEVEDLRARLRQNPRNSSKPPSAEGLAKPALRSRRGKRGRKPGRPEGQPGRRWSWPITLTMWSPMSRAGAPGAGPACSARRSPGLSGAR